MRKANADFKTAFLSEAGARVVNNDYFGFVELDEYACYVIADGLYELEDAESARLAVETIIMKFQEHPSISRHALQGCLTAANKRLVEAEKKRISMKASVTVVVTDYEKMRYASAGNTRLYLYRSGAVEAHSRDMSLGQAELENENASPDLLSIHRERNNLYCYLGQSSGFAPYVSETIKLKESDIITLLTRGIWEHIDDGELQDVFGDTTDDPQESVDIVEELLLSRQPENLDNYTIAAIFINQVFHDPKKRKRLKKIIIIAAIVLAVAVIIVVIVLLYQRDQREKREAMESALDNAVVFIGHDNYTKALSEAEAAYELAEKVKDKEKQADIDDYIKLAESILKADELLKNGDYTGAQEAYLTAQEYAMRLNQVGLTYIEKKLELTREYMRFYDFMELGDTLCELGENNGALEQYRQARDLASALFYPDGKRQALDGIERVYAQMTDEEAAQQKKADAEQAAEKAKTDEAKETAAQAAAKDAETKEKEEKQKADEAGSADELLSQGDGYYGQGEYGQAKTYYQLARNKYSKLQDSTGVTMADSKIKLADQKLAEIADQKKLVEGYVKKGDDAFAAKDYVEAKKYYNLAKQLYQNMNAVTQAAAVEEKLENVIAAVEKQEIDAQAKKVELDREVQAAADLLTKGDTAYTNENYTSAKTYYQLAKDKYEKIGDISGKALADKKIEEAEDALMKELSSISISLQDGAYVFAGEEG